MYKKVTHSIVEEHFDHPMAQEIKKMVDHGAKMGAASWPPGPKTLDFKQQLDSQFNKFNTALRNVIVGSTTNDPALPYNKQQLSDSIAEFGAFFEPYYGITAAESAVGQLADFAKSIDTMITAAKNNGDWNTPATAALGHLQSFATTVGAWYPAFWQFRTGPGVYLGKYGQAVADQVSSRAKQDWAADSSAAEQAQIELLIGNGITQAPFSIQLGDMITQQFPEKFR